MCIQRCTRLCCSSAGTKVMARTLTASRVSWQFTTNKGYKAASNNLWLASGNGAGAFVHNSRLETGPQETRDQCISDMMSETTSWSTSTSLTVGAVTAVSQQAVQGRTGCCAGGSRGCCAGGAGGCCVGGEQGVLCMRVRGVLCRYVLLRKAARAATSPPA